MKAYLLRPHPRAAASAAVCLCCCNLLQRHVFTPQFTHLPQVGTHTKALIESEVLPKHENVGDVRGMGLLFGVEFVKDKASREPDARMARHVMNWLRDHANVLVSTDGPHRNVIKIKPPLCFSKEDGEHLAKALDGALTAATA